MGTYDSNSTCSFSSSCNIPSYSQATQALGALFRWTEEQSKLDLQFETGMPRGYKKCNVDVGTYVDKEVWTQGFFRQVREELTYPHNMGVHNFTWMYGHETVILSRHARNKYVNDGIILVIMLLFFCE